MRLAIMQPYFFPYIGYWQLIHAVDKFVIYDDVQFTKKGWFHRNRLLFNNKVEYFSINLKKDSDYLDVRDRYISPVYFEKEMPKILRKIAQSYSKAPYFHNVYPLIKGILEYDSNNLFDYLYNSIKSLSNYIGIDTEFIISSTLPVSSELKNKWRIFKICEYLNIYDYLNPIGGKELYKKEEFKENNVNLNFIKTLPIEYEQKSTDFFPNLSIIDVLMFNSIKSFKNLLNNYVLD